MYCEECGRKIPDGAKFCDKCGTPVRIDPNEVRPEETGTEPGLDQDNRTVYVPIERNETQNFRETPDYDYGTPEFDDETYGGTTGWPAKGYGSDSPADRRYYDDDPYSSGTEVQDRESKDSRSRILTIVLCLVIAALSVGIVWQLYSIISVNRALRTYQAPSIQSESGQTEQN